jgi:hypothetical protein
LCGAGSGPAEVAPKQLLAADTTLAHEVELDWPEKHHLVADQEAMMIMAYGAHEHFSSEAFSSSFLQLSHGQQDIKTECKLSVCSVKIL